MSLLDPIPDPPPATERSAAPASATGHWPLPTGPSPDLPPALEKSSAFRAHAQDRHALQQLHGDFRDKLPHIFNPPEELLPKVLAELCDPETSLVDVACIFDTTVHAVSVWMTRPDIAQQLADFQNAAIVKARTAAACQLPKAVRALTNIVDEFNDESDKLLWNPRDLAHITHRIRSRDCARRAATLLTRLARLAPIAPARNLPPGGGAEPSPRGDGAGATAVLPPLQRLDSPTAPDRAPLSPLAENPWAAPPAIPAAVSHDPQASHSTSDIPHPTSDIPAPSPDTGSPRRRCEPVARAAGERSIDSDPATSVSPPLPPAPSPHLTAHDSPLTAPTGPPPTRSRAAPLTSSSTD